MGASHCRICATMYDCRPKLLQTSRPRQRSKPVTSAYVRYCLICLAPDVFFNWNTDFHSLAVYFFIFFWFIFTYFAYFFFHLSSCLAVLCLPVWPAAAFGSVSSFFVHRCLHLCGVHSGPGNVLFDLHQRMTNRQRYELCQEQIFGNRCRRVSWLHIFFGTSEFNIAIMFKPAQDNWYPSLAGVL